MSRHAGAARRSPMALLLLLLLLSIGAASAAGAPPSAIRLGEPSLVGNGRYTAWTLAALPNPQRGGAMDLRDGLKGCSGTNRVRGLLFELPR